MLGVIEEREKCFYCNQQGHTGRHDTCWQEMLERAAELLEEVLQQQEDDELYDHKIKRSLGRP